jgi:molybdate transport system substrate-binding protein
MKLADAATATICLNPAIGHPYKFGFTVRRPGASETNAPPDASRGGPHRCRGIFSLPSADDRDTQAGGTKARLAKEAPMWFIGHGLPAALLAGALLVAHSAQAAELKVLSGNGARAAVGELISQFERASGHKVAIRFEVNAALKRKIEAGETFDVAVLNPPVLDDLIRQGKIVGARADIGRAGLGVAVRAGAPKPDIGSVEAFKRTLLATKSVAFPGEGASGRYFVSLLDRLGIAAEMKGKLKPMEAEDTVEVVARGEADMVVVVSSRIHDVSGVDVVGPLPAELQTMIGFAAGLGAAAKEVEAAKALIRFLTAPAAAPVLKAKGVEPI